MTTPDLYEQKRLFEEALAELMHERFGSGDFVSKRLLCAVDYALSSKGKRLRPLLVLSMAIVHRGSMNADRAIRRALPGALAVEYIHTYSLVHDDLPAMDNDDFRRGRLCVHRRFDEALAILAGDAMLTDAFFLASNAKSNAALICRELALAAGSGGLVAGQSEDLNPDNVNKNSSYWQKINAQKTARLFEASAVIGALLVNADQEKLVAARKFGRIFGEAFQMQDDYQDKLGLFTKESAETLSLMVHTRIGEAQKINEQFSHQQPLRELLQLAFATAES